VAKHLVIDDIVLKQFIGIIALLGVCAGQYFEIAKLMIDFGANVNHRTPDGRSPVYWAAACDHEILMAYLLDKGADINLTTYDELDRFTPLHVAAHYEHEDTVRVLIDRGADLMAKDLEGRLPIDLAKAGDNLEVVKLLSDAMAAQGVQ
jgi:ankyrin repeat protein